MRSKTRVHIEDSVLGRVKLRALKHQVHACLHRAHGGNDALGVDVNIDERLDESRGILLEFGQTANGRIDACNTIVESSLLSVNAYLAWCQSWHAHFKTQELLASSLFHLGSDCCTLADSGL